MRAQIAIRCTATKADQKAAAWPAVSRRSLMRRIAISMAAAWLLAMCPASFAQEWVQYASKADLFAVNFPSEPKTLDITYMSEFGISLPGHIYSAEQGQWRPGRRLPERLAVRRAGLHDLCGVEVREARRREGQFLRLGSRGPGRRPARPAHERRCVANVRRDPQARHTALRFRSDGAQRCACARAVSAVADVHRRRRQADSVPVVLYDRLFGGLEVPSIRAAAHRCATGRPAASGRDC